METDLKAYLPQLLALLGVVFQWARSSVKFPEWAYHVVVVMFAAFAYFLVTLPAHQGWRLEVILFLLGTSANVPPIWGGTFIMSSIAKGLVAGAGDPAKAAASPFVPLTDSKGKPA